MRSIGNVFLTKREVSTHEAIKRVLSLPMRHSNIDVLYVPTGLKKNRTRMLKSLSVLEKMHPDDTNVFASNIIDKYENRPDDLNSLCLADFASNYVSKANVPIEPDEIKSYTVPVSNIEDVAPNPNVIVLKNEMGEMRKRSRPCVIRFHKISKLKSPEEHYLRLIQLYMPWRNEEELKHDNHSYEDRYKEVEDDILCNISKHEPYLDIDYEELQNINIVDSDEEEDNAEFSMINPDLLDLDLEDGDGASNAPVASTTIDNLLLPNDHFYQICSQLNEGQHNLFNFIMQYAVQCKLAERNNELPPTVFKIFLSGGAGVGKSYLVTAITEYLRRILRYPNQNLDHPSVLVTASTGKAATGINGITLHSAFRLPVTTGSYVYKKPGNETLHMLRNKYQHLKVLIIDEISMTGRETFGHLDLALKAIMQNLLPFGGISLLAVGDFLQLPPVIQKGVFMKPSKGLYKSFNGWLWEEFQLHELLEIVRQISDPDFAQLLNRVREGKQTTNDLIQIKALMNTDTTSWPAEFVKLFLNNHLAGKENEECISKLDSEVVVIKARDNNKDVETNTCSISIPDNISLNQTANLPSELKLCVGARVLLTVNINVPDRLMNGAIGTVLHLDMRSKPLCSTIYVKFDDPIAGNSLKDRRLRNELKECVPITAITKKFPLTKGKSTVVAERKQFPLILGHAITIHKSQGSTLDYMKGDINRSTGKKTKTGKEYQQPVSQGQFYTLLSRAKSRDKVLLLNFEPEHIKVNRPALEEMERMREESLFLWKHPLIEFNGNSICLFNIRSWDAHLEHFLSEKVYSTYPSLLCFTETNINDSPAKHIDQTQDNWKDIHKSTQHGLALCYKVDKVNIIEVIQIPSVLEILPVVLEIEKETILLVIVYRMPGSLGTFIDDFILMLNELPTQHRMLIVGDFNLDQMLPENIAKIDPLIQNFNLSQRSQYSTHIHGGILDLVFDTSNSSPVSSLPSPYSDHFVLFFKI